MKANWKPIAVAIVMVVVVAWALSSLMPGSASGKNLTFNVVNGKITMTNPGTEAVAAHLIGTGSRTFNVVSSVEGAAGASVRDDSGSSIKQVFDISIPAGTSDFTVSRGTNVQFSATTETRLAATIQSLSDSESRTVLIIAALVLVGGLFYISRATGHRWLATLRGRSVPAVEPVVVAEDANNTDSGTNRGRDGRMYSNYGGKE